MTYAPRRRRAQATWRTAIAIASLLLASVVVAVFLPTATTVALMWLACRADCSAFGWHAITYAPALSAAIAAAAMSALGMRAFHRHVQITPATQHRMLRHAYLAGAVSGLLVLAATPHLPIAEEMLASMASRIAQQI